MEKRLGSAGKSSWHDGKGSHYLTIAEVDMVAARSNYTDALWI